MSTQCTIACACPACGEDHTYTRLRSLNATRVPLQVERILAGDFGWEPCPSCGADVEIEHPFLYSDWPRQLWVVVYPLAEEPGFSALEEVAGEPLDRALQAAPKVIADQCASPRLFVTFGWDKLAEIIRLDQAGLDKAVVECAKMQAVRHHPELLALGPLELLASEAASDRVTFEVRTLLGRPTGHTIAVPSPTLAAIADSRSTYQERFPELFAGAYVDASRYLRA